LKEIEYATLIPYSFPYSRDLRSVIIPDILTDSKGNIYFINRIPYIFMNKYENIIGNWSGTMPGIFNGHYTSIHKFDKNYNMVKSAAVVFVAVRHFLIDKNDELILIGDVNETILDEIWLHDDCLKPTKNEWWKQGKDFHYKIGIMKLDKDLKYLRSGSIPGGYFIDYFDESTAHYFPNSASDALLDDENNIYLTNGIANYFYNAYIIDGSETYKRGNIDYTVDIDKHNYDVGIMKVKNDLTKILYSTIYGGSGVDVPGFIFLNDTIVTIVGATDSKDIIVTPDADVSYPHNPTERLFVAKLSTNTPSSLPSEMPGKTYIFPNPASTYIELPESLMSRYSEYHVTDLLGRTISMNRLQIPRIDISALPTGTYKLTLTHGTDIISYLFIKME